MSSQGRTERQKADYYATPAWAIDELLPALTDDSGPELGDDLSSHDLIILDPCAGGDDKRGMAYPAAIRRFTRWNTTILKTVDIRPDSQAEVKADYLTLETSTLSRMFPPDIIISNPPFDLAMDFIKKGLRDVRDGGLVVMLQRVNFFGAEYRFKFWEDYMPKLTYVHSKRMRFLQGINPANGKPYPGDSIEYAHFVWQKGITPKFTKLRVLKS